MSRFFRPPKAAWPPGGGRPTLPPRGFTPWPWLLLLLPIALGLWRLRFDVEVLNLLPADSPVVHGLKLYQQNFANARELILTVRAPDAGQAETAARAVAQSLRARPDLVAGATWTPPWLEQPGQAAELMAYLWLNQPPQLFAELTNRLTGSNLTNTLAESREALATSFSPNDFAARGYDPLGFMRLPEAATASVPSFGSGSEYFTSADGTFRVILVEAAIDLTSYKSCAKWLGEVRRVVEAARSPENFSEEVVVRYTGRPTFVAEIGGGMERDLAGPSAGTLAVIALLFYLAHRRWRPLLWLLALLVMILAGTLALGGLVFGTLNVVSLGFASILIGLAEDFGIVLYHESRTHPHLSIREIRHEAAPGIWWSALTTAGAFLLLNLSSLPGLGQLGTLVAIGVALAAVVMLYGYLPPLLEAERRTPVRRDPAPVERAEPEFGAPKSRARLAWAATVALVTAGAFLLSLKPPRFDQSPEALKPKNSQANAALDELKARLNRTQEPLWVVIEGRNEIDVARRLASVEPVLQRAVSNQVIVSFTLPTALWPRIENQPANRPAALALAARRDELFTATLSAGFSTNSLNIAASVLQLWGQSMVSHDSFWPTNANSRWVLEKLTARFAGGFLAVGLIHPKPSVAGKSFQKLSGLGKLLREEGVWLSGWELLGPSISELVRRDLLRVLPPILALVLLTLWLAFRTWRDVLLSLVTLVFAGLALHVVMTLAGWSWNMMNLMALPLLLGMGVDFSIHIQLALRRHQGDAAMVSRSVGRALLLAGSTTVAGFASLAFASNAGIAGLGKVCAVGIVCAMLAAVYLLPVWWRMTSANKTALE
jgi:predicted RND superfamily exporter protein